MISSGTFEWTAAAAGFMRLSVLVKSPREAVVVVVVGSLGSGSRDLLERRKRKQLQLMIKMGWGGFEAGWSGWCPLRLYLMGPSAIPGPKFVAFSRAVPEARDPWREWSE